jgi:hypothetical protein
MRLHVSASLLAVSLVCLTTASTCDSSTEPKNYFLSLSTAGSGSGSVSASPAGNADNAYLEGTVVTVTATPAAGSDFTGWNEADVKGCTEPKNPCTLTMSDRKSVVANFAPSSGAARFDGLYTGDINQATPGTHPLNLTVVNGVVQGKVAPVYGSLGTFTGAVTASGEFSALINAQAGPQFTCQTRLSGTITTSLVDGIMTATLNGKFQAESVPGSIGCGAGTPLPSGNWSATRDRIPVDKVL